MNVNTPNISPCYCGRGQIFEPPQHAATCPRFSDAAAPLSTPEAPTAKEWKYPLTPPEGSVSHERMVAEGFAAPATPSEEMPDLEAIRRRYEAATSVVTYYRMLECMPDIPALLSAMVSEYEFRLRAENGWDESTAEAGALREQLSEARKELERWREIAEEYAQHDEQCAAQTVGCICGLKAAFDAASRLGGEKL